MKFYEYFANTSRKNQVAIIVWAVHFFAIFGLISHHFISRKLKPTRPMIVRTITPPKPEPKIQSPQKGTTAVKKSSVAAASSKTKPKPAPQVTIAKKAAPTKVAPAQKKEETTSLKEIAKSLETLHAESKQSKSSLTLPSIIPEKPEPLAPTSEDPTYGEYLITYLQSTLDLPEYGPVKVRLEIDRFGKLIDCEILETKSLKNAEFLKKELPLLSFPYLNEFEIYDSTKNFIITFINM